MKAFYILLFTFLIPQVGHTVIPEEYNPMVIKAPFSLSERVFDLNPAIQKAQAENKNLFIRLGGMDCPPCREYDLFLYQNRSSLKEDFSKVIVIDIQTWIQGPRIFLIVNGERIPLNEFKQRIGDKNTALFYPTFWYLNPGLQQIRQAPRGNTEFLSIEKHRHFLRSE